ncbi:MAG: hypothetical protein F6K31_02605 [Symploca sp. SIO2G7]|nr:hypothetical protein [Symploca sp. SIO2G7]
MIIIIENSIIRMGKPKGTDIKIIFSGFELKEAFKIAALKERNTISNLGEKIIKEWMIKNGYYTDNKLF